MICMEFLFSQVSFKGQRRLLQKKKSQGLSLIQIHLPDAIIDRDAFVCEPPALAR